MMSEQIVQIATHLLAAMLQQGITERHTDFSQFDLTVDQAETIALNALNLAHALMRVDRELQSQYDGRPDALSTDKPYSEQIEDLSVRIASLERDQNRPGHDY